MNDLEIPVAEYENDVVNSRKSSRGCGLTFLFFSFSRNAKWESYVICDVPHYCCLRFHFQPRVSPEGSGDRRRRFFGETTSCIEACGSSTLKAAIQISCFVG